jgi:rhamnose transport system permease protein
MIRREFTLLVLLATLLGFAWLAEPSFLNVRAQTLLGMHIWELAILSLPMLLIVISGGIDLSIGSMVAFCAVTMGLLHERGSPVWILVLASLLAGCVLGLLNGWFVAKLKVHPLIVTLATLAAYRGLAEGISGARPLSGFPESIQAISGTKWLGLPVPGYFFLILALAASLVLGRLVFGAWVYAIGTAEKPALFSGIPVARVKLMLYGFSGLCAGLAAIVLVSRNNTAKADMAMGLELDVITAVVLGGAKIEGGEGTVFGLILGVLLIHETRQFVSWHWKQNELNFVVVGGLLIGAVLLQRLLSARKRVVSAQSD